VRRHFTVLLAADELAPEYRWRLVTTLYAQRRSLIEGSVALAGVDVVCLAQTRWAGFAVLAALALAAMAARLRLARRFERRQGAASGHTVLTPESWASRFTSGAMVTSLLWCATNVCAFFGFNDPVTDMFVVMVEAGWLSSANVRNAPSPLTVVGQTVLTAAVIGISAAVAAPGYLKLLAPFSLIMMSATLSIAAYMRSQMRLVLLTEQKLAEANERLTQLSATDALTGIGNRRAFDAVLQTEWARAAREAADLALLVIDVDYFKKFNDRYGHPAGDACLRLIAEAIESTLRRPPDFAARFGGEEFVAVLPGTVEEGALDVAERLCRKVRGLGVPHAASHFGVVTISVGAASMAPRQGDGCQLLIDLADQALYDAKQAGRNRSRGASARLVLGEWAADRTPAGGGPGV
jgi:diguanylate cyclase (GGDEF)-like protein